MFKSYRKWGEPTIIEGRVMEPKCFLVENMEEFENLSLYGIGSIAVVPSTGEIYYLSYEGGWKLWGGGSNDGVVIEYIDDSDCRTLQMTWREIKELFDTGKTLTIGEEVVTQVYDEIYEESDIHYYFVISNDGLYTYETYSEDGYPERSIGGVE